MASIERGLGAKRVHAKSTVSMHVSKGLEQGQVWERTCTQQSNTRSAAGSKNAERAAATAAVVRTLQLLTKNMKR